MKELEKYQAKSITPIDDYSSCSISKDLQALAERELRETEEIRNFSINALRDWAISNPRIIKMRLDSNWLLRHLRFKKFSIPMAQEVLERHIVLKQGSYGMKYYNKELDLLQPRIKKILSGNVVCLLPTRDAFGRRIFMLKVSNLKIEARGDFLRDIFTILDIILHFLAEDEETQIRGVQYVIDMSGLGLAYFKAFPVNDLLRVIMNAERVVALRHKGIHFVNFPTFWNLLINIVLKQVSEKLRTRVKFYKNVAELDFIDKKFLPKEYGFGGSESMKELSDNFFEEMLTRRDLLMKHQEMKVRAEMYPPAVFEGSFEVLKIPLNSPDLFERVSRCCDATIYGVQGSFRKLEID